MPDPNNLPYQNLPEATEREIRDLFAATHEGQVMGTSENKTLQVQVPGHDPQVFMTRTEGYSLDAAGAFVRHQYDQFNPLACCCTVSGPHELGGVDYQTGQLLCRLHLCLCAECRQAISYHRARQIRDQYYCPPCAWGVRLRRIVGFPLYMLRALFWGLLGQDVPQKPVVPPTLAGSPYGNPSYYASGPVASYPPNGTGAPRRNGPAR